MTPQDRDEIKTVIREVLSEFMRPTRPYDQLPPEQTENKSKTVPYAIRAAAAMEILQRKTDSQRLRA